MRCTSFLEIKSSSSIVRSKLQRLECIIILNRGETKGSSLKDRFDKRVRIDLPSPLPVPTPPPTLPTPFPLSLISTRQTNPPLPTRTRPQTPPPRPPIRTRPALRKQPRVKNYPLVCAQTVPDPPRTATLKGLQIGSGA